LESNDNADARISHTAVAAGSKMYIFGGMSTKYLNDFFCYDFNIRAWTTLPITNGPSPRSAHTCVVNETENALYVFGGFLGESGSDELFRYDIS
jgi:hypothetical protein